MDFVKLKTPYIKIILTKDEKVLSLKSKDTIVIKKNNENTYKLAKQVVDAIKQKNG